MVEPTIDIAIRLGRPGFGLCVEASLPGAGTTVVFGPSGSGKTTLLRALAGLEPDTRGSVSVAGRTWQDTRHALPAHCRRIGVVFQHAGLLPHLDVRGNLEYGWRRARAPRTTLDRWIGELALGPLLGRAPASLSGGERQRVALARALATDPQWLLLDEPLSALDAQRRSEILPLFEILRARARIPILYVTHSIEEASRLSDYILLLDQGNVVAQGPAMDVLNRGDLPLALRDDAGVVVDTVIRGDDGHGLLELQSRAGILYTHGRSRAAGSRARVRIQARDVSLALQRHADTSLLNVVPATVESLQPLGNGQVQVALLAEGQPLLARIAHRSVGKLALQPGAQVFAQVKAVALLA